MNVVADFWNETGEPWCNCVTPQDFFAPMIVDAIECLDEHLDLSLVRSRQGHGRGRMGVGCVVLVVVW